MEDVADGDASYYRPFLAMSSEKTVTDRLVRFCRDTWGISAGEVKDAAHEARVEMCRALVKAGLQHIPVISLNFNNMKKVCPQANIAAVDYDPGASEVNQLNRIKLMLAAAKRKKK